MCLGKTALNLIDVTKNARPGDGEICLLYTKNQSTHNAGHTTGNVGITMLVYVPVELKSAEAQRSSPTERSSGGKP
jgi:hypothetical protein